MRGPGAIYSAHPQGREKSGERRHPLGRFPGTLHWEQSEDTRAPGARPCCAPFALEQL
jgi:hypothetical protein